MNCPGGGGGTLLAGFQLSKRCRDRTTLLEQPVGEPGNPRASHNTEDVLRVVQQFHGP